MNYYRVINEENIPIWSRIDLKSSKDEEIIFLINFFNNFNITTGKFEEFSDCCQRLAKRFKELFLDKIFQTSPSAFYLHEAASFLSMTIPNILEDYLLLKDKYECENIFFKSTFSARTGSVNKICIFLIIYNKYFSLQEFIYEKLCRLFQSKTAKPAKLVKKIGTSLAQKKRFQKLREEKKQKENKSKIEAESFVKTISLNDDHHIDFDKTLDFDIHTN